MKQIYLLTVILFLPFINLNAQTITLTGTCTGDVDGDYELSADMNGKPSYFHDPETGTGFTYTIYWTGTRWELIVNPNNLIGMHNDSDTPTPPATSFSAWTPDACDPTGIFTGDGTTLSVEQVELISTKIYVYPNPSSEYITVSGLKNKEYYRLFNYLGVEILNGTVGNNKKIEIRSFSKGLYFLKFDNGNTMKFIKE